MRVFVLRGEVFAHVLFVDGLDIAVLQVLLQRLVDGVAQGVLALSHQDGGVAAGAQVTGEQAQVSVRVLFEVLSEGHGVVRGHLCTAREDLLDSLIKTGNNHD